MRLTLELADNEPLVDDDASMEGASSTESLSDTPPTENYDTGGPNPTGDGQKQTPYLEDATMEAHADARTRNVSEDAAALTAFPPPAFF